MRVYQFVVILRSSLTVPKREKLLNTIKEWLKDLKVAKEEDWGQKALSYPIKKERNGYYVYLELEGEGSIPAGFDKRLLGQEDVLRHLVIRKR